VVRHGTSLLLMSECSLLINSYGNFERVDPSEDWEQSEHKGQTLYYVGLQTDFGIVCSCRCFFDAESFVIEYITTNPDCRRQGYATTVVDFVKHLATTHALTLYVIAIEESCPYWVEQGFYLSQDEYLAEKYNCYDDTHLLRLTPSCSSCGQLMTRFENPRRREPLFGCSCPLDGEVEKS
jgi:GNAT superfamily N-acetyltransferase